MTRLLVHVEGQTEEGFVNEILAPHLYQRGYRLVSARLLGSARMREHRGGVRSWGSVRKDIARHLLEDDGAVSATFVDYYGMPASGQGAWPGRAESAALAFADKSSLVDAQMRADLTQAVGEAAAARFIPFVVMHEFEALLFSDCEKLCNGIGRPQLRAHFEGIRSAFATPEAINDSPHTAPSKRIIAVMPGYQKPLYGVTAALEIGLDRMRAECPMFNAWLNRLEMKVANA